MVLRFFLFAVAFLFASCSDMEFNNPYDPDSPNYIGKQRSSSSEAVPSSNSAKPSSSSVVAVVSSSSSVPAQTGIIYGKSVDYQGETYQTVLIGNQTWFKRNLNYDVSGSVCYDNDPANCTTYGKLYDWATAMGLPASCNTSTCASQVGTKHKGICPSGWHIPSEGEWSTLTDFVGSSAGTELKANSSLWYTNTGTDIYGFSALPGGDGYSSGSFYGVGYGGYWWSATENNASYAYYHADVNSSYDDKTILLSVRCVQD